MADIHTEKPSPGGLYALLEKPGQPETQCVCYICNMNEECGLRWKISAGKRSQVAVIQEEVEWQSFIKHLYLNQETDSFAIALSQTWARPWFLKHWGPAHDCAHVNKAFIRTLASLHKFLSPWNPKCLMEL